MERRLIVMRHAQAGRGDGSTSDHDRPLTDKGRREAVEIAERLVELGWVPGRVLASDAVRTRQTFEAMESTLQPTPSVSYDNSLYLAGVDAAHRALVDVDDEITDVLLLGHNPGWQAVVSYFGGTRQRLTTANAALLHTTADSWDDAANSGNFELIQVLRPRSL